MWIYLGLAGFPFAGEGSSIVLLFLFVCLLLETRKNIMVEDNGMWNPHCVYIIYESKRWEPFLGLFGGKMPIFVL